MTKKPVAKKVIKKVEDVIAANKESKLISAQDII
jgi:hypothetical protein